MDQYLGSISGYLQQLPELPPRPKWEEIPLANVTPLIAVSTAMEQWSHWADRVENEYQTMYEMTLYLDVSDELFTELCQTFSVRPIRPSMPSRRYLEDAHMERDPEGQLAILIDVCQEWEAHADWLHEAYDAFGRSLRPCKLKPEARKMMESSQDDFGLSRLSLSAPPSLDSQVRSSLGSMLEVGRPTHIFPEDGSDEWAVFPRGGTQGQPKRKDQRSDSELSFTKEQAIFNNGGRESIPSILRNARHEAEDYFIENPEDPDDEDRKVDALDMQRLKLGGDQEMDKQ